MIAATPLAGLEVGERYEVGLKGIVGEFRGMHGGAVMGRGRR